MEAPTTNRILPPGTAFAPALLPGRGGFYAGIHDGETKFRFWNGRNLNKEVTGMVKILRYGKAWKLIIKLGRRTWTHSNRYAKWFE